MKKTFTLILLVFMATHSFAQFVGASSVGFDGGGGSRKNTTSFFKPHSDSYNSGFLVKANLGMDFDYCNWGGLDLGYRFNQYLYAGIGFHLYHDIDYFVPIEMRVYLPLQNVAFFMGGFAGFNGEGDFDYPLYGGCVGVNRRYWTLSLSCFEMYGFRGYEEYVALSLEYSLPLKSVSSRIFRK